jgi:hypothetical protein
MRIIYCYTNVITIRYLVNYGLANYETKPLGTLFSINVIQFGPSKSESIGAFSREIRRHSTLVATAVPESLMSVPVFGCLFGSN